MKTESVYSKLSKKKSETLFTDVLAENLRKKLITNCGRKKKNTRKTTRH